MNYVAIHREGQQELGTDVGADTVIPISDDVDITEYSFTIPESELRAPRRVPVRFEQVGDFPIDKMLTMESVGEYHIPADHCMGYRCRLCGKSDESFAQVEHHERCDLKSEFSYEAHDGGLEVFRAVIRADHDLLILEAGETTPPGTLVDRQGKRTPVHVWCAACCCGDDSLDQLEHSEVCDLQRDNLLGGEYRHGKRRCTSAHADD